DVVAVLRVAGEDAVLDEKRLVGPAVARGFRSRLFPLLRLVWECAVVGDPSGHAEDDLGVLKRDQLEALRGAEVVESLAMRLRLPELVVSILFFQARRNSDQRRHPVRLLALDTRDARKPV